MVKHLVEAGADLKGTHVNLAHIVVMAADWSLINALLPAGTNHLVTSGWLDSLHQNRPINQGREPIPWITYPAIDFLDDRVDRDWSVFEWGGGYSTLWWARRVRSVVSIEDDEGWCGTIRGQMPANVALRHERGPAYARAIMDYPDAHFDVIVIDGSDRNGCAQQAAGKIKPRGMIILDNSDGADHLQAVEALAADGYMRLDFWGLAPSYLYKSCTSIFFRDASLLRLALAPSRHQSSTGMSCFQVFDSRRP